MIHFYLINLLACVCFFFREWTTLLDKNVSEKATPFIFKFDAAHKNSNENDRNNIHIRISRFLSQWPVFAG